MSQEATVILMDNSNYMRNGDLVPDRFQAEKEALHYLCNSKRRQNVENTCAVVTTSKSQVVCTLTSDPGKVMSRVRNVQMQEDLSLKRGISIAHLVLRNRLHRNQKPRIVAFVGSPITESAEELTLLAKKLKKEKVSVIIVNFGEVEINEKILTEFVDQINTTGANNQADKSVVINIPNDSVGIQEYLNTHPAITGTVVQGGSLNPVIQQNDVPIMPGFDEDDDPDLAYALRISLDEQRAIQESAFAQAARDNKTATTAANVMNAPTAINEPTPSDEEMIISQILAMTQEYEDKNAAQKSPVTSKKRPLDLLDTPSKNAGSKRHKARPQKPSNEAQLESPGSAQFNSDVPTHLQFMTEQEQIAYAISMSIANPNAEESQNSSQQNVTDKQARPRTSSSDEPNKKRRKTQKKDD